MPSEALAPLSTATADKPAYRLAIVNNTKPSFEVRKREIEKLDSFDCKITLRADMSSYDVGHEISLLRAHILRLAGKSESDVDGVRKYMKKRVFQCTKRSLWSDLRT